MTVSSESHEVVGSHIKTKTFSKCWCISKKERFDEMDKEKRKKRIKFLWSKLRMMVKSRGLLSSLLQASVKKERELFGLDPSITQ